MTQEVLPILEAHAARPKPPAEGVLEVVNANLGKPGARPCAFFQAVFSMRLTGSPL